MSRSNLISTFIACLCAFVPITLVASDNFSLETWVKSYPIGTYISVTARIPKPEEFAHLNSSEKGVDNVRISFHLQVEGKYDEEGNKKLIFYIRTNDGACELGRVPAVEVVLINGRAVNMVIFCQSDEQIDSGSRYVLTLVPLTTAGTEFIVGQLSKNGSAAVTIQYAEFNLDMKTTNFKQVWGAAADSPL